MFKTIIVFFILFLIFIPNSRGLEIEKVTPSLQYLYNYYYDRGALEKKPDSSFVKHTKKIYSSKSGEKSDSLPIAVIDDRREINDVALCFVDSIPYIHTMMKYHGDENDLHALDVNTGGHFGAIITVRFPLSKLPEIASLPTVEAILDNAKVDDPMRRPRIKIFRTDEPELGAVVYEKSADKRQLCFQITTARLFPTTGYKLTCNDEIIGNNIYVHIGTSSPDPDRVVGMAYSGANGECCLDFVDSVFYVHFISGDTSSFKVEVGKNLLSINVIKQGNLRLANIADSPFRRSDNDTPKKP